MNNVDDKDENLLIKGKPEELADLVLHVAAAAAQAKAEDVYEAVRIAMKEEWYGPWDRYGPLGWVTSEWVDDVRSGVPDPDGLGEKSREELVEAFAISMDNPIENEQLGVLLAAEEGREAATLGTLFRAGHILCELHTIDPYFSVVRPGLESYYNRLPGWGEGLLPEGQNVAEDLRRILEKALESPARDAIKAVQMGTGSTQ